MARSREPHLSGGGDLPERCAKRMAERPPREHLVGIPDDVSPVGACAG